MKKALKLGLQGIAALLVIAAIALGVHYYLLDRFYQERLKAYEKTYAEQLPHLVAGPVSPEDQADVHAFFSYAFLNDALNTLVGPEWQLSPSMTIAVSRLHFTDGHGTPLLDLMARLHFGKGSSIDIKGVATLAPLAARDGQFITRLQIVALEPTVISQGYKLALHGLFGDLTRAVSQQYLDKLPEIKLPISQNFKVPVAGATTPLTFPTGEPGASISGNLITPGFTLADGLVIQHAVLLQDGLHLFLGLTSYAHPVDDCRPRLGQPQQYRAARCSPT
jgi:hypothetical protein